MSVYLNMLFRLYICISGGLFDMLQSIINILVTAVKSTKQIYIPPDRLDSHSSGDKTFSYKLDIYVWL